MVDKTRKFPTEIIEELCWSDSYVDDENNIVYKTISNEIFDKSRWSTHHWLVFSVTENDQVTYYGKQYDKPATEMQDCDTFEEGDDAEEVACIPLVPREKTIIEYVAA